MSVRYVARFNNRHERTGTLWEGRYKSCLVDTSSYVLACYRYIELNPVRARMVEGPEHFPWSSYNCNAMGHMDTLLTPHPCYQGLGQTAALRVEANRAIVRESLPDATVEEIRLYLQQQRALGRDAFRSMVEAKTQRFAGVRPLTVHESSPSRQISEPDPVFDPAEAKGPPNGGPL